MRNNARLSKASYNYTITLIEQSLLNVYSDKAVNPIFVYYSITTMQYHAVFVQE